MRNFFLLYLFLWVNISAFAQFAPPAGQIGSTAIHADSSIFVGWANACSLTRGYQDISNIRFTASALETSAPNP